MSETVIDGLKSVLQNVRLQAGEVWQLQAQYVWDAILEISKLNLRIQELDGPIGPAWKPFFFQSDRFHQIIEGPEGWKGLRASYPELTEEELLASKEATYSGTLCEHDRAKNPNYGFSQENDGVKTLRDFMAENKMLERIPPKGN
jgi:hypothetical protein